MEISVYHGFKDIHFEMLGYFLEYIKYSNIKIDIYSIDILVGLEWKKYYEKTFNMKIQFHNPLEFDPEKYKLIFLLTDDDMSFHNMWIEKYGKTKIVCIDHCGLIRRENMMSRIGTRFYYRRPYCLWALPTYIAITKLEKKSYLQNQQKIKVMCIGIQNRPPSIKFLENLFENFSDIEFHIIARNISVNYEGYNNIFQYQQCPTEKMCEIIKDSRYVLCIHNPKNNFSYSDSISGAIPMAYNNGCQIIIPDSWQNFYNYKTVITYRDNEVQYNGETKLNLSKDIPLDDIYDELYTFISNRNRVFNTSIRKIYPELDYERPCNNWFTNIIKVLKLHVPYIFIETGTFKGETVAHVKKDFLEIHSIEINPELYNNNVEQFKNDRNVYLYEGDSSKVLKDICHKVKEPGLFFLDAYYFNDPLSYGKPEYNGNPVLREVELIGRRPYNDIIVISNYLFMGKILNINSVYCNWTEITIDNIIKSYNRPCVHYVCKEDNRIVLIPQMV